MAAPVVEKSSGAAPLSCSTPATVGGGTFADIGSGVFSPDGRLVAAGAHEGWNVTVWRWRRGRWSAASRAGLADEFSADGSTLHNAGFHGIESWDIAGDRQFTAFTARPETPGERYAWSPRGDLVATHGEALEMSGIETDTVSLLRTDGTEPLRQFRIGVTGGWHTGGWNAGDWRPDATAFVVGKPDGDVVTLPLEGKDEPTR